MIPPRGQPSHRRTRPGLGIAEAVVSTFVVSLALVAAMSAAGGAIATQVSTADRARARLLADALLGEIMTLDYEDPAAALRQFGPEAGESATSKANYNDVDDFNGWAESPPRDRANAEITGFAGWRREVIVAWVDPANPNQTVSMETGAKRITVTVKRNGRTLFTRTAIRAKV
jgi:MSHA pilin protein MshD